jgi:RNA-directed DNA polymerase
VERRRKKGQRTAGWARNRTTPHSVQKWQKAWQDQAKESPNLRFYARYDKVYRKDVLALAYHCCKAKDGAAGVDGQTLEEIEE